MNDMDVLTMKIGADQFGVPVLRVRDVLNAPAIHAVPLAPGDIAGSINLRGRIATIIDLGRRLNLSAHGGAMCVIVDQPKSTTQELCGFLVGQVGEVVTLPAETFEPAPMTLDPAFKAFCLGVYRREGALLVLHDIDAVLANAAKAA